MCVYMYIYRIHVVLSFDSLQCFLFVVGNYLVGYPWCFMLQKLCIC